MATASGYGREAFAVWRTPNKPLQRTGCARRYLLASAMPERRWLDHRHQACPTALNDIRRLVLNSSPASRPCQETQRMPNRTLLAWRAAPQPADAPGLPPASCMSEKAHRKDSSASRAVHPKTLLLPNWTVERETETDRRARSLDSIECRLCSLYKRQSKAMDGVSM